VSILRESISEVAIKNTPLRGAVSLALIALFPAGALLAQTGGGGGGASRPDSTIGGHFVAADVDFMQGMISHHAQALQMVALIPSRTNVPGMLSLGQRIAISQRDEIAMMQSWLKANNQPIPVLDSAGAAVMPGMAGMSMPSMQMPGMLTAAQMVALKASTGTAFERLFLEGMIQHHQGAITMVTKLLGTPGAGQASEIFRFANDVVADQTAEISRMQAMLAALPKASPSSS
jgi:uncharacterized protein (DUF305 family)